jgi:serine carboxypeptidase-like clade I
LNANHYNESVDGSIWLYPKLKAKNYKMLFISGDNDAIVPTQGTQKWINELNWEVTEEWRPYFYKITSSNKQLVGYIEQRGNFTLATVHNAGHFISKTRRRELQALVYAYVSEKKIDLLP